MELLASAKPGEFQFVLSGTYGIWQHRDKRTTWLTSWVKLRIDGIGNNSRLFPDRLLALPKIFPAMR